MNPQLPPDTGPLKRQAPPSSQQQAQAAQPPPDIPRSRLWIDTRTYWSQRLTTVQSPVAVKAQSPRMRPARAVGNVKAPADGGGPVHCDNYTPARVIHRPKPAECPELLDRLACEEPVRRVRQSEGLMTLNWSIASENFTRCSAFLILNEDRGETLLIHHDSGVRSRWNTFEQQLWGEPVSPATPTRELLLRERLGYADFMKQDGRKCVLLIESQRAYDRGDVLAQIGRDGARVLPRLTLHTPGAGDTDDDTASWSMVYRPQSDELLILMQTDTRTLLSFSGVMQDTPSVPPRLADGKSGAARRNLVDDLPLYREAIARAGATLDADALKLLDLCVKAAAARNSNFMRSYRALQEIARNFLVPPDIRGRLIQGSGIADRDGVVMDALTDLADRLLAGKRDRD